MTTARPRLLGLCVPPLAFYALDLTLTMVGQSPEYWAGDYSDVREVSPTLNHLLQIHPAMAIGFGCVVGVLYVAFILLLPDVLALAMSITITFGHVAGAFTWLLFRYEHGYQMCNTLFLSAGCLMAVCFRYGWRATPTTPPPLAHWPWWVRTGLVAAIFGIGIYLYFWPRVA